MSDHADWGGLNAAVDATGAERVFVTHGYTAIFARWLRERGLDAAPVETEWEGETLDAGEPEPEPEPDAEPTAEAVGDAPPEG
jgi:putative mRNA 3-end processing factor